jgi:putative ABC transport system permease protein
MNWRTSVLFARRELRGGIRGFKVFLGSLAIGVAAIAAVGSLAEGLNAGMEADGRAILGGDADIRIAHRELNATEREWLEARGQIGEMVRTRAIARAQPSDGAARSLVELKAVDNLYPLYGNVTLAPAEPLAQALESRDGRLGPHRFGLVAEQALVTLLKLKIGDPVMLGDAEFELRGVLTQEPDRAADGIGFGPRAMISTAGLAASGLMAPSTLAYHHYRMRLGAGEESSGEVKDFVTALEAAFPDAGWRVREWRNSNPSLTRYAERLELFLIMVALTALLVGGVGVANAVRGFVEAKTPVIAVLKSLGASESLVFRVYLLQVLALAAVGIVIGLGVGWAGATALAGFLSDFVGVPIKAGFYGQVLAEASGYGFLIALAFALWPLSRVRDVAPAGLFRDLVTPAKFWPAAGDLFASAVALAMLAVLLVGNAQEKAFAAYFIAGALICFVLLALYSRGIVALAHRVPRLNRLSLRWAIANIERPGAPTVSIVLSLGLGLALLVAITLIQSSLSRELQQHLPKAAPAFFFTDILPEQADAFEALVRAVPNVGSIEKVPSLRGQISRINGEPVDLAKIAPDSRWVVQGDRMLTYAADLPAGSQLTEGQWWPKDYSGPPLVSMEQGAARGLGLKVGGRIGVNVLGRQFEAEIANLRQVEWLSFGINFVLVFAPGLLEGAPYTYLATVRANDAAEETVFREVTDRFTNITPIRVREIIAALDHLLGNIGIAVRITAGVTLLVGIVVLAGALAASHRRRVRDAVIFKVLGATRADMLKVYFAEYAALGLITAIFASGLGWIVGWLVVTQVMHGDWSPDPVAAVATALGGAALTVVMGLGLTWKVLGQPANRALRNF